MANLGSLVTRDQMIDSSPGRPRWRLDLLPFLQPESFNQRQRSQHLSYSLFGIGRHEVFLEDSRGVYLVRRQDASFSLTGATSNSIWLETCGVDFRNPPDGVVLTRVAGVSCMVLPVQIERASAFRLWLDPSYGSYLWDAILEIVRDHGGDVIGLDASYPSFGQANSVKGETT